MLDSYPQNVRLHALHRPAVPQARVPILGGGAGGHRLRAPSMRLGVWCVSDQPPSLIFDRQGHTVVLTMSRSRRRNALTLDLIVRLADAWAAIDADDTIRSAILTGAEGAYCVGGDLDAGWMTGGGGAEPTANERRVMEDRSIIGRGLLLTDWLRTPIIAVVNGDCMGGGCEMLQQTDIRIAEAHARFGVPEARRGLIQGFGDRDRVVGGAGGSPHRGPLRRPRHEEQGRSGGDEGVHREAATEFHRRVTGVRTANA